MIVKTKRNADPRRRTVGEDTVSTNKFNIYIIIFKYIILKQILFSIGFKSGLFPGYGLITIFFFLNLTRVLVRKPFYYSKRLEEIRVCFPVPSYIVFDRLHLPHYKVYRAHA